MKKKYKKYLSKIKKVMMIFLIILLVLILGPITVLLTGKAKFDSNWDTAPHNSTNQSPNPIDNKEAIVQVFAARSFSWRGAFGVHTWLAVKPENSYKYLRYEKIGWLLYRGQNPVNINDYYPPDGLWYGAKPLLIKDIRGDKAQQIIDKLERAVVNYPFQNQYRLWPGPNSNTFVAYLGREIPQMELVMPSLALGKDYTSYKIFSFTPSRTGIQISLFGIFGFMVGMKEGIEINFMSLTIGISYDKGFIIKYPGFGDVKI